MEKLEDDIQEIYKYQIDPKYVQDRLTELDNRSCRNNIKSNGIGRLRQRERRGSTQKNVQGMFAQKLGLHDFEIERAHLVKHNNIDSNTKRTQTIVVKLF